MLDGVHDGGVNEAFLVVSSAGEPVDNSWDGFRDVLSIELEVGVVVDVVALFVEVGGIDEVPV